MTFPSKDATLSRDLNNNFFRSIITAQNYENFTLRTEVHAIFFDLSGKTDGTSARRVKKNKTCSVTSNLTSLIAQTVLFTSAAIKVILYQHVEAPCEKLEVKSL